MTQDKLFRRFVKKPGYLREIMPISVECSDILEATFHPLPARRITIPELRKRILEIDTLFMSEDEIRKGDLYLRNVAASYWPKLPPMEPPAEAIRCQSICADEEALAVLGHMSNPMWRSAIMNMRFEDEQGNFVIVPSTGISPSSSYESCSCCSSTESSDCSCSSGDGSNEPRTPETSAQIIAKLAQIPELPSNEKIGKAMMPPVARKGRSML